MDYERLWERLVDSLSEWSSASVIGPGRIDVTLPHGDPERHVTIVMSPDEWNEMAGVMWGDFDDAVLAVKRTLLGLEPHEGFAVYSQYQLEASAGPTLPEPKRREARPGGQWVALDREGRVVSRFADWSEPDESSE